MWVVIEPPAHFVLRSWLLKVRIVNTKRRQYTCVSSTQQRVPALYMKRRLRRGTSAYLRMSTLVKEKYELQFTKNQKLNELNKGVLTH